jgi:hypothetical protein
MINHDRLGGRRIELLIPFDVDGERVEEVSFGPWKLDYTMRWRAGKWPGLFEMMVELSSLKSPEKFRELRSPDDDRVVAIFMEHIPASLREEIVSSGGLSDVRPQEAGEPPIPNREVEEQAYAQPPEDDGGPDGTGFDFGERT